jgi:hypothetical protein
MDEHEIFDEGVDVQVLIDINKRWILSLAILMIVLIPSYVDM